MRQDLVHITEGGLRYHQTSDCHAFAAGRMLNDFRDHDRPSTRRMARIHPAETVDWKTAAAQGKTPCLSCWPPAAMRYLPQPPNGDFGHRPVLGFTDGRGLGRICARGCGIRAGTAPHWLQHHRPVAWPCTSAIVLGLTRRPHHPEPR
jgi:hypothetical protein